jgi:hypothetical protein
MKKYLIGFAAGILAAIVVPMTLALAAGGPSSPSPTSTLATPQTMMAVPMMMPMMMGNGMGMPNAGSPPSYAQPTQMMAMPLCCPMCMQMMQGGMTSGENSPMGMPNMGSAQSGSMMAMPMMKMPMMMNRGAGQPKPDPAPVAPTTEADPHAAHHATAP